MKEIYVYLLLFLITPSRQDTNQCEIAQACITDLTDADCGIGSVMVPNANIQKCCPKCVQEGTGGGGDDDINIFPPDYCRPPSDCLDHETYAPVQCKGDIFVGRCFCSDAKGNRIFGQMWKSDASNMKCACSRRRHEIEANENRKSTLHCTPSGDYEPLQCDDGICWCANPSTGQPTAPPLPEADMTSLPCYSLALTGEQYLRKCESIVNALATIAKEQSEHGTNFLGNPLTFCDYDGSYGSYQIQNGIAYCTGLDGKILGAWQMVANDITEMNCNCARDTMIHFPQRGMTVSEVCLSNGNYRHNQNAGSVPYCVDTDGYPIEEEDWPSECREERDIPPPNNNTLPIDIQ